MKLNQSFFRIAVAGFLLSGAIAAVADDITLPCAPEPTDMTIQFGDIVNCTISPVGDTDMYRFDMEQGTLAMVSLRDHTNFSNRPQAVLSDANGIPIDTLIVNDSGLRVLFEPQTTGQYTFLVNEWGDDDGVTYTLAIQRILPHPAEAQQVCYDCVIQDAINVNLDSDVLFYEGTEGETIMLTLADLSNFAQRPSVEVFDPDGVAIDTLTINDGGLRRMVILEKTGVYTALVREYFENNPVSYHFALQQVYPLGEGATPVNDDQAVQEGISPVTDSDVHYFEGITGETITLTLADLSNFGQRPTVEVFDPDGVAIDTLTVNDSGLRRIIDLEKTGTYAALVREYGDDQTVSYNLFLQRLFPLAGGAIPIQYDDAIQTTISPVTDSDVYYMCLDGDEMVTLMLSDLTNFGSHPIAEIYSPNDELIATIANNDGVATWSPQPPMIPGNYTILIRENGDDGTVTYNLLMQCDLGPCCEVDPVSGAGLSTTPRAHVHALSDAIPNPFNPQTTITFEIPQAQVVTLRVFDMAGRLVRELIGTEESTPGRHEVVWNGRDDAGRQVASGTYFYRLEAGSYSSTKRMVLVK